MKLLILSDLHLEFAGLHLRFDDVDFDAAILAGDIHSPGERAVRWATKTFKSKPVVLVAGNHEYFNSRIDLVASQMQEVAMGTQVQFLDAGKSCGVVPFGSWAVRFGRISVSPSGGATAIAFATRASANERPS